MFFERELETMDREGIRKIQLAGLRNTLSNVYQNVPLYTSRMDELGIKPEDITSLEALRSFPLTTKEDIRDTYPYGMFARPMKEIKRIHGSSGTTGKPTIVGYTNKDLDTWSTLMARLIRAVGVTDEDVAQISFGYGLFTGALGLQQGLEKVGATVIPMSSGNTDKQLMLMEDMGVTVLVATPSYALYLSEVARERDLHKRLKLRVGLFGGEGCTHEMRTKIEENLGVIATDNYGMSELIGPGVSGECIYRNGLHIAEDHFYPEIIDPDTLEVLPEGSTGELIITSLTKEAFPILRYRTRDITKITYEPCACGRTHARMSKVIGRSDDMLIIKGVNVFPSQIEGVLMGVRSIGPHYHITLTTENYVDQIEVAVELIDGSVLERYSELESIQNEIRSKLRSVLGLETGVKLMDRGSMERFTGKAKRVTDLRKR